MATVKSWSGTGLTAGTLTVDSAGTGDTPFSSIVGTALSVDASGPRSPQIKVADGTGQSYAVWSLGTLSAYAVRFYVTQATASAIVCQVNDGAGDKAAGFDFNSSSALRLSARQNGTNVNLWVATAAMPTSRTRVEYAETSAGVWSVAYYAGDSATAIQSGSGTKTVPQSAAALWAGRISGAIATSGLFLDDLAVANTAGLIGPAAGDSSSAFWTDCGTRKFQMVRL